MVDAQILVVLLIGIACGFVGGWHHGHQAGVETERQRIERWARRRERSLR